MALLCFRVTYHCCNKEATLFTNQYKTRPDGNDANNIVKITGIASINNEESAEMTEGDTGVRKKARE